MVLTQTMPLRGTTRMAFPTSTYLKESSKTTRTKVLDGIPLYLRTGTRTTTRPRHSQPITLSKSPLLHHTNSLEALTANSGTPLIGLLSMAIGATNNTRIMIQTNSASWGLMRCASTPTDLRDLHSSSCRGRRSVLIVRRLVLFGMFWCRGMWMAEVKVLRNWI